MTDQHRRVLVVAYYFPPMGLSGVQRTLKFVKYLPEFGWKATVLTVAPTGYFAMDRTLLKEAEEADIEIVRTSSLDPNRLFRSKGVVRMPSEGVRKILQFIGDSLFVPDTKIGWRRKAVRFASGLIRKRPFDAIFATAPPQTDLLIGYALKKKFDIPLVVEYRDAWLDYPFKYYPTPFHRVLHARLEKKILKASHRIIVTHRRVKEDLLKRYAPLSHHDVVIISQGFDPSDFTVAATERAPSANKLRITHTGTFYGGRDPSVILHALKTLQEQVPTMQGKIELRFVGTMRKSDQVLVKKLGLQKDVVFTGYLDHPDCVREVKEADVLWFVIDNDYQTPGKLYEYFGSRKPIIASVDDGYTKQLLNESGAAFCVPPRDRQAHINVLKELVKLHREDRLPEIPASFAERFDRVTLAGKLAKEFESLMDIDKHAFRKVEDQS